VRLGTLCTAWAAMNDLSFALYDGFDGMFFILIHDISKHPSTQLKPVDLQYIGKRQMACSCHLGGS
jgi:hypothetical protein